MAVVFPAPAGAIASWRRAPEVAICGDQGGLPGVEGGPVGGLLEQRQRRPPPGWPGAGRAMPAAATRRSSAARICGAGVDRGAGDLVHAGAVDAAQLRPARRCRRLDGVRRTDAALRVWSVTRSTSRVDVLGGQVRGADLALRLGAHVPDLPGRAAGLDLVADPRGGVPHPRRIHRRRVLRGGRTGPRPPWRRRLAGPPRTSSACSRQAARCSVRVRGSCLASRVSRVACWASGIASTTVGGRPWSPWNAVASSPRRASMLARRVDQRRFRAGSTPTTSRIGRLPRSVPARSAKTSPSRVRRCFSRAVL